MTDAPPAEPAAAAAPRHALRHRDFRLLFAGGSINSLGNGIAPVALAFAVLDLGGDAAELGLVVGLYALTDVLVTLFGGVAGDRFSRRLVMTGSMLAAAVLQAAAGVSLLLDRSSIAVLALLGAALGAITSLGNPSMSAILGQTVPAETLGQAVVWRRLGSTSAAMIGSGIAGLLVATAGSGWALLADAATFLAAGLLFAGIRVAHEPAPPGASLLGDVADGFREVMRHTWLWLLIAQALLYHLVYGGVQGVLGPIVVGDDVSRAAWGYALSTLMAGFVVGGLVCTRWKPRHALSVGVWFLGLTAAFPLAIALSDHLAVILLGAFLHGFGLEIFSVGWDLSIQENIAPDKLARVYSFDAVGSFVARPIGLALTGPIAAAVGYDTWLITVAVVLVASVVAATFSRDVRVLTRH
ncbi:MFS transporter [Nocardioides fonticola]|uniref:MFS transporter n=1 Tax=Nocardioides fonticola TaxID=450363 RepID=A0ABP7XSP4_9ACTN